jgi:hypothetical protein
VYLITHGNFFFDFPLPSLLDCSSLELIPFSVFLFWGTSITPKGAVWITVGHAGTFLSLACACLLQGRLSAISVKFKGWDKAGTARKYVTQEGVAALLKS